MSDKKPIEAEPKTIQQPVDSAAAVSVKKQKIKTETSKAFSVSISLMSLTSLIAVALVGYLGYLQFQKNSVRLSDLEKLQESRTFELSDIKQQLKSEISDIQLKIAQSDAQSIKILSDLSQQIKLTEGKIRSFSGRHQSDWLLAEADYLVRIAGMRLSFERDHITALALLLSADERIVLMDDPGMQPVREALFRDMAVLRLLKKEDLSGTAIRVSALIPQLKALPVQSFHLPKEETEDTEQPLMLSEKDWLENLQATLKELSVKWFDIRNHGRPVSPLMSSESETLLLTNMTLLLQTAQFAILKQHSDLYHHSLKQLKQWITEYFDLTDPIVLGFNKEIDALDGLIVGGAIPKTLDSSLVLHRVIELRSHQGPQEQKQEQEQEQEQELDNKQ